MAASESVVEPSDESVVVEGSVVVGVSVDVAASPDDDEEDDAPGITALTALWQADESLATFFSRHCNAAAPPGETLEQ